MASLIEGYTYDIFISYRQKDNKYDGWVTEFVDNLKKELEATFKEEISVYFDINPHDGLLETHDVDASLKEKLKCLVFIPVISRTYCDPGSFAWNHEFKPFVEQASNDNFGLKVILKNGNVASRVLPVRIHDIETNDLRLFEGILDGVMRSIDFIYKSAGVNRPLRSNEDHPHDNLNKIYYRDQINKIANAIEEIISSLKKTVSPLINEKWTFKESAEHTNVVFQPDHRKSQINESQIKIIPGKELLKKYTGGIHLSKAYLLKIFQKHFLSVLFISLMIVSALIWKGYLKFPGTGNSRRELARAHVRNAVKLLNDSFYIPAKTELDQALAFDPGYSTAWSTLAAVNVRLGNLNDAILQTIKAIELDKTNDTAAYNLAFALDENKDFHQAVIWYSRAIELDSAIVPAYSALGNLYNRLNQPVDAILILRLAKDKFPQSERMYLIYKNLGNSHLLMKQFNEAIKWLELSLQIQPSEPETCLYLAKALEGEGKIDRSIDLWQKYIDLERDSAKAFEAKKHLKEITIRHLQEIMK
jgi:tetratricopeptide (TPR) repeat protein